MNLLRSSLCCATILLLEVNSMAQDIDTLHTWIVNGDFEQLDGKKLKRVGGIQYAKGWSSPTAKKADLFSENATVESTVSTPKNFAGEQTALSGANYAGVRWWSYQNKEPRTYLQTQMKHKMKKDSLYCVRFYTTLGDLSKYATGELGAYFSKDKIEKDDALSLTYEVTVPSVRTKVYGDMFSWVGVCGTYESKGNEEFMLIGNFAANEKTINEKAKRPKGESRQQVFSAYYYIDNVEVYPVKNRTSCSCEQLKDAESEYIFSRKGVTPPGLKPAEQAARQTIYFKRFQRLLDPSMEPWVEDIVEAMKADPAMKIELIGHFDAVENDRTRVRPDLVPLAKERAEAVRDALVEAGVETARILCTAKDANEPADETGTEVGMSKNRRVTARALVVATLEQDFGQVQG
ncbi:MAG TPA: OmpA family protein, partial [Flavobacteriales bacterium]|nr:OmpA family protein [Flavobacteriales bacterium]